MRSDSGWGSISVLLGSGLGEFSVGHNPASIAVGDMNGDQKPDLAITNGGDANVSVLLGDGAGGFGAATNFSVGSVPYFLGYKAGTAMGAPTWLSPTAPAAM
jgi:hypothetical protein